MQNNKQLRHFEFYYDTGGHGGQYCSPNLNLVITKAMDLLRGCPSVNRIEIRPLPSNIVGGYGEKHTFSVYIDRAQIEATDEFNNDGNLIVNGSQLFLGDVVRQLPVNPREAFNELTVVNIADEYITFYRHFTHLADFTYTGGVLAYVGISTFQVAIVHPMRYERITNIFRERK